MTWSRSLDLCLRNKAGGGEDDIIQTFLAFANKREGKTVADYVLKDEKGYVEATGMSLDYYASTQGKTHSRLKTLNGLTKEFCGNMSGKDTSGSNPLMSRKVEDGRSIVKGILKNPLAIKPHMLDLESNKWIDAMNAEITIHD
ncbi:hypothetical protein Tco_0670095 [Tanacetum coccineum]